MDNEPTRITGSSDADPAERARETELYRAAVRRTSAGRPHSDAVVRERLGAGARVVSSTGSSPGGGWEQLARRAQLANVGMDEADGYRGRHFDPDSIDAENRQFGPAVTVAKNY